MEYSYVIFFSEKYYSIFSFPAARVAESTEPPLPPTEGVTPLPQRPADSILETITKSLTLNMGIPKEIITVVRYERAVLDAFVDKHQGKPCRYQVGSIACVETYTETSADGNSYTVKERIVEEISGEKLV